MNIFELIFSPFLFLIDQIFKAGFTLTNNYGLSILFLSFIVSLILLPVFILIEKAKKKDDKVKLSMKPLVDEIKRCYKGQERYYYLKTLNRQFDYSPLRALIPILSLLLQIPFFIAAYQYLESFEPLKGVSFLFISDLSLPDGIFGVVNVLPIFMTLVNLVTAYFYTRNSDGSERKQMLIVAVIFLVLLFKLPSGLVLYWTMNNVFSFFRLFITNPEVFKRQQGSKTRSFFNWTTVFLNEYRSQKRLVVKFSIIMIGLSIYSQVNWALLNDFNTIVVRLIFAILVSFIFSLLFIYYLVIKKKYIERVRAFQLRPFIYFSLLFLSLYFFFASQFHFLGPNFDLGIFSFVTLIPLEIFSFLYLFRYKKIVNSFWFYLLMALTTFLFVVQFLNSYAAFSNTNLEFTLLSIKIIISESYISDILKPGILIATFAAIPFYQQTIKREAIKYKSNWVLLLLSLMYLIGFIFIWDPLIVYSTFPENFEFAGIDIVRNNINYFIVAFLSFAFLYFVLPAKAKRTLLISLIVILLISFFHNTLFPLNMGTLQQNKYVLDNNLDVPLIFYFLEGMLSLATVFLVRWIFNKNYFRQLFYILLGLNFILIFQSIKDTIQSGNFLKKNTVSVDISNSISFSKDKENVVVILTDMFHGWYMEKILKQNKSLQKSMEGFVWYPNTFSVSLMTSSSIGALLGGYDYTVDKMNLDKDRTIGEQITEITEIFRDKVKSEGYEFTSTPMIYSTIDKNTFDTYLPKWHPDWDNYNKVLSIGFSKELGYSLLWGNAAFYSAPLFLKPIIYNHGKWMHKEKELNENNNHTKPYNFLRLLPYISDNNNDKGNFVYLHSMASHHPWDLIDENGTLIPDVPPFKNNEWTIKTIGKWINWMKENDVYDNTKIIILSDHGPHWGHYQGGLDREIPLIMNPDLSVSEITAASLNALMLVKDFNKRGDLKKDMRLMSNADASSIMFGEEGDPTKGQAMPNRKVRSYYTTWITRIGDEKAFDLRYIFEVENNYFDMNNWHILYDYKESE